MSRRPGISSPAAPGPVLQSAILWSSHSSKSFNFRELCIRRVLETIAGNTIKIYNVYASRDCTAMQDWIIHNFGPYSKALLRFARHQENQIRDKLQEPPRGIPVHRSYIFLLHNWNKSRADMQISNQIFWILYESWSSNLVTLAGPRRITTYFENVQLNHHSTRSQNIAIHSQTRSTRSVSSSKTSLTN